VTKIVICKISRAFFEPKEGRDAQVMIILDGFLLLAVCVGVSRWHAGSGVGSAVRIFIPIWLAAAAINMWIALRETVIRLPKKLRFLY
jgi:hypothetical protein